MDAWTKNLWWAARDGDVEAARQAARSGADLEAKDEENFTPLALAAVGGHEGVCALLLELGARVDARGLRGASAALWAAQLGREACLAQLIEAGADLSLRNEWKETALIAACRWGQEGAARLILGESSRIELNALDQENMSALSWAAHGKSWNLVSALIEAGADMEAKNRWGASALDIVARSDQAREGWASIENGRWARARNRARQEALALEGESENSPRRARSRM